MKIAIFTDMFLEVAGGIPSSIKAQRKALLAAGHEVTVFCPGHKKSNQAVLVPTCRFLKPGGAPLARNPRVVERWILANFPDFADFDIVHVHYEAGCSIAGMRLARRFGIPLIQTMHGREDMAAEINLPRPLRLIGSTLLNWFHSWYLPHPVTVDLDNKWAPTKTRAKMWTLMVNHANYADQVLTPSDHFGKKLKHYGVTSPIVTLSNGIEDALVPEGDERVRSSHSTLKMIWNSRLSREKRILPFLEALNLMERPYQLDVYGAGNDALRAKIYAKKHGLNVYFHGTSSRRYIFERMKKAHLGVMASYQFDTQGMALLEAEATGLPVFFCDPDMKEFLPEGGYVCADSPEPSEMAHALDKLETNPRKIEQMSKVMLMHRKEVLQSNKICELEKIYKKWYK